jgi:hypothetical protein
MKRPAKSSTPQAAGRKAVLYTTGQPKPVEVNLPVATPAELLRSLNLTPTAKQRVERAIVRAGLRRKTG